MGSSEPDARHAAPPERLGRVDRERAEELVLWLVASQADSLLRVARRYSLCADDAYDAYQRGLEILMHHAERLDPERAAGWLHTVVKHEALAINRSRRRMLGAGEVDLDGVEARTAPSPEEHALAADRVGRSAEALHGLKPQEVRALWLKALGYSYEQICEATGWTYTKTNRCLAEGRKSFLERYARIESGGECERLAPLLSAFVDGEADPARVLELRRHLRGCPACRASVRGLHEASQPLTVVFPAVGLAAASGGAEQTSSFFVRVYETITLSLNERAANSFLRAQAIVDTVTAGKMAAAAASAAAVAGGGVAVQGALKAPATPPAALVQRAEPRPGALFVKQLATRSTRKTSRPDDAKPNERPKPRVQPNPHRSSAPHRRQTLPSATPVSGGNGVRAVTASAPTAGAGSAAAEFGPEGG